MTCPQGKIGELKYGLLHEMHAVTAFDSGITAHVLKHREKNNKA
jgi:hypothetical protein